MASNSDLPLSQNLAFIETLYERYLHDPASVPARWGSYFEALQAEDARDGGLAATMGPGAKPFTRGPSFEPPPLFRAESVRAGPTKDRRRRSASVQASADFQERVDRLVHSFRVRGHMLAQLDPLGLPRPDQPELDPAYYGFTEGDRREAVAENTSCHPGVETLGELVDCLRDTYCRSIGIQFMHIHDLSVRWWLRDRMETTANRLELGRKEQLRILTRLTDAVIFEEFISRKYPAAKSFSLSGSESLIPLLDLAIEKAGDHGVREIVLAMAHRGRLNVLANILEKSPKDIFREFDDIDPELHVGRGDVKYHLGHNSEWRTASGHKVHLSLCFNPSHLEYVSAVALGRVRAKQDRVNDGERVTGMPILIHGDSAFAGEGVVQETLNLSQLDAYWAGGAIHVVINNQIGFTTPTSQSTSGIYATSVARMLQIPIFHVNGEDPEAVAQVVELAMDFRREFQRDVVIDVYSYRRHGHNEIDEPAFTQPLLYQAIRKRKSVQDGYLEHLLKLGDVTEDEAQEIATERKRQLDKGLEVARSKNYVRGNDNPTGIWEGYFGGPEENADEVSTSIPVERAARLLEALAKVPDDFHPHPKIQRWLAARREMASGKRALDWSAAEALAFGSLATDGHRVRLTGQDSERGTFSHRHAVLHDVQDGHGFMPLKHLAPGQAAVEIHNSSLSEAGVLGFEYGYSLDCPEGLIAWEAQFGDFVNAAQVIIDQFLSSAEDKWNRLSGLVLLLPHAFEGMGPEHSSARLERFLTLAAEDNMQVVYPTTPAQYFHLLRRQALRRWRKPLVVLTPKSLLRNPAATSSLEECVGGRFERILGDGAHPQDVSRILLCSGKIFFDLDQRRQAEGRNDVAIIRVEQLYPFPEKALAAALLPYPATTSLFWVQEEPENMGAWPFMRYRLGEQAFGRLPFQGIFRPASASPATGSASTHRMEQEELLDAAFDRNSTPGKASTTAPWKKN